MARIWFARRRGGQWVAPDDGSAFEGPLAAIIFPLDLGTHRRVVDESFVRDPTLARGERAASERVLVEIEAVDLEGSEFSGYETGLYDSPLSRSEAARRLASLPPVRASG